MTTRAEALAIVRRLAADIHEPTEGEAVARLLERIAKAEPEASAALLEVGALALLRETRPPLRATGMGHTVEGLPR